MLKSRKWLASRRLKTPALELRTAYTHCHGDPLNLADQDEIKGTKVEEDLLSKLYTSDSYLIGGFEELTFILITQKVYVER